jgi:hypothetical protein
MFRIRSYLAYGWALLAVPLVLVTFMGMPSLAGKLVAVTGLHVHPMYTGGEVAQTLDHPQYKTIVHRPVFDGLIGQRQTGFVQIRWEPAADANLPDSIDEQIDFDQDGKADLRIQLDTATDKARLEALDKRVVSVQEVIRVGKGRIVRIDLRNPSE